MTDNKPIIDPERFGLWIVATFIIALLALVMSVVGLKRIWESAAITQAQIVVITNKLNELQRLQAAPAVAAPAAPAALAAPGPESK